jgi:hypothetical protein
MLRIIVGKTAIVLCVAFIVSIEASRERCGHEIVLASEPEHYEILSQEYEKKTRANTQEYTSVYSPIRVQFNLDYLKQDVNQRQCSSIGSVSTYRLR